MQSICRSLVEGCFRSDKVTEELDQRVRSDREGEAIFRRILMASKVSKPSLRLSWVASLDEQAIRDA